VDSVGAHRTDVLPAVARTNPRLVDFFAAPRREHHVWIAPRDLVRVDDAILGEASLD